MEPPLRDRIILAIKDLRLPEVSKQERLPYPTYEDRVLQGQIHYQPNEAEAAQLSSNCPRRSPHGPNYADYQVPP